MENTPRLYDTLVYVLSQHAQWVDQRHLKTRAWMMVGLLGYLFKAGHSIASTIYRESLMALPRPWQVVNF